MQELILNEVEALKNLIGHDHILSIIDVGHGLYEKNPGKSNDVSYIVLELA